MAAPNAWAGIDDARDDEVWRVREQGRAALIALVRKELKNSLLQAGVSGTDAEWADEVLDPRYLVIGFSRRFATYKRATLLLSQPERLRTLLLDPERPIQLVFAGKAHPADDLGKQMIAELVRFSRDPALRHRIVFVEGYDIAIARIFVQGSDVWLNTPRRPMEASGTSGEKAALNGALNCSILDGWWDECFDGTNGWAIASAESYEDLAQRDRVEADSLFEVLERQIVPLFYDRRGGGRFPRLWVERVKGSLRSLGYKVQASRMVSDYVQQLYEPTAGRVDQLSEGGHARARALAEWKQRVGAAWPAVRVVEVDGGPLNSGITDLGDRRPVRVKVDLGHLSAQDVAVEMLHGPVVAVDELATTEIVGLTLTGPPDVPWAVFLRGGAGMRPGRAPRVHPAGCSGQPRSGQHGGTGLHHLGLAFGLTRGPAA